MFIDIISIELMILICVNICGVCSKKHILILFFVVSSPSLSDELTASPNSFKKKPDVYFS